MLHQPGSAPALLVADQVGPWWADRLSRGLAPLRDAAPGTAAGSLPARVGLSAVLGLDQHESMAHALALAWSASARSTVVPIGHTANGPFRIDLAADGPHVLVAGTTGAGKSELLRTLVASLAVHHRPEHLSMVLIDYKGGAAFRDCAPLPHVAAVVTDLDEHLAARALVSLRAELKRRERLLAAAGVADFPAYERSSASSVSPLARLVIVIDEFRALAEELPQFIDGMVAVAALGRSLGVHLVLATQRPAGVVTADIKANLNLRIGLRLRDRSDSLDVIDAPDAAALDPRSPGRALARVAGGPVIAFQAAHASARTGSGSTGSPPHGVRVRRLPWGAAPAPWATSPSDEGDPPTDLSLVVSAVATAVALVGAQPAESPWLPALPERIEARLAAQLRHGWTARRSVSSTSPHCSGSRRSRCRSTNRATGASSAARGADAAPHCSRSQRRRPTRIGPSGLHLYAVSAGSLAALRTLPHCGAHVETDDAPRLERLVARLSGELAERRAALGRLRPSDDGRVASRGPGEAHRRRCCCWSTTGTCSSSAPTTTASARLTTSLLGLLREGAGLGLTAALAGDRALLVGRAASAVTHRVLLRMNDPTDLLLAGLPLRLVPTQQPPGRGLLQDGTEVQIALPLPFETQHPTPQRQPWRVDALPDRVAVESLPQATRTDDLVMLGVGGDELAPRGLSPGRDGRRWAVIGASGSGVSTALATIACGLSAQGRPVCVVATPVGPWESLRRDPRIHWCDDPGRIDELVALRRGAPDLAVVVDDADQLVDTPLDAALREVATLVDRDGGLVVIGAKADAVSVQYRGLAVAVARHRTGVLLGPASTTAADVLGVRVPVDREASPGRGHLVRAGVALPIQVASTTVRK